MRRMWFTVLMMGMLTAAGLISSASERANAQQAASPVQLALMLDGTLNRSLPPLAEQATHNLCGIGLGGFCPGRVRSCIRSGRPKAECEAWGDACSACNHAMVECRQKVGHVAGATCGPCRAALSKCRAALSVPAK